jgi:hypothetical protein
VQICPKKIKKAKDLAFICTFILSQETFFNMFTKEKEKMLEKFELMTSIL